MGREKLWQLPQDIAFRSVIAALVAIWAFSATASEAEPASPVDPAPPTTASSFYLVQDTDTMKCRIVDTVPAADSGLKIVGGDAHPTRNRRGCYESG